MSQKLCEVLFAVCVLYARELPEVPERLDIPVAHLQTECNLKGTDAAGTGTDTPQRRVKIGTQEHCYVFEEQRN